MLVDNPNCDFSTGTMLDETGEYEHEITEPGEYFFACTFGGHCSGGNHQVRVIVPAAVDAGPLALWARWLYVYALGRAASSFSK